MRGNGEYHEIIITPAKGSRGVAGLDARCLGERENDTTVIRRHRHDFDRHKSGSFGGGHDLLLEITNAPVGVARL